MPDFKSIGEFGFINQIATHPTPNRILCGIGDDCAVIEQPNNQVRLVTTDMMVEAVHFFTDTPPEGLGHKLLAVNISDIAAMGGTPTDAVISLAVPPHHDAGYLERLYNGLYACADRFDIALVGGDTTRSNNQLVLNISLTGHMNRDHVCYRSGAQTGDLIYVSGTLGDAAGGLALIRDHIKMNREDRTHLLRKFNRPEPQLTLGQTLAQTGVVTAMMDVSDGVASDLRHICKRSQVSAVIHTSDIPLSESFVRFCEKTQQDATQLALSGGEDYELLFTIHPDHAKEIEHLVQKSDFPQMTCLGYITDQGNNILLTHKDGSKTPLTATGYDHFKTPAKE
jgi:thiamine-monophosphate kinase